MEAKTKETNETKVHVKSIEVWTSKRDFIRWTSNQLKKHTYSLEGNWIEIHTNDGVECFSGCKFKITYSK